MGNHARTKLIPALIANGQRIAGLVTRGDATTLPDAPVYPDVETALAALPSDTVFVLASPPILHFCQAMPIIRAGRDVIVEKPAFISRDETVEAAEAATRSGSVLVEAFMHRHTKLYAALLEAWRGEREIVSLKAEFLIPEMPTLGTFRHAPDIASSSLYDMGCYPLSLLSDLGLPLDDLDITRVDHPGDPGRERVTMAGWPGGVEVHIGIGVGPAYVNRVTFQTRDDRSVSFEPFFFGRPGERRMDSGMAPDSTRRTIQEENAFEAMFAVPRSTWAADQAFRLERMAVVAGSLERLGCALATFRKDDGL